MKKYYLLFTAIFFANILGAQIINFPDANLKAKLLAASPPIDTNGDGEIEVSEAQVVTGSDEILFNGTWFLFDYGLDLSNSNISDLTGISYFTALTVLDCSNNLLTTLDISNLAALRSLNAHHNNLNSFTVYGFDGGSAADGGVLDLSYNQISVLDIDDSEFDYLDISYNNLTSIDLLENVEIHYRGNFSNNQFTLLNFSNISFWYDCNLYIGNNVVDKVVFFGSQPGNIFYSSDNTFFDLGNFSSANNCSNETGHINVYDCPNLEYFILKNGVSYTTIACPMPGPDAEIISELFLSISNCPNLNFICVDEEEQPYVQAWINQWGLQDQVQVNSYCTFTPGGTYYTINGNVQFDSNANGCDGGDFSIPNQQFSITDGTDTGTIISDASGNYTINVGAGTHTITPIVENAGNFVISPTNVVVNFPTAASPIVQNICISAGPPIDDFDITLVPVFAAIPGFDSTYKLIYKNTGNGIDDGTLTLSFEDDVLDFVSSSSAPTSNSGGNIVWTFENLIPFESRSIDLTFHLNTPLQIPPLNSGDILSFTSAIGQTGATTPFENSHNLNQVIVNSFDPNDKTCLEGNTVGPEMIGEYVHYMIRFENTGTYPAQNIVVKDMLDSAKFDVSTLIPISGSHPFETRISSTNKVEFIFENIMLPFDDSNNDGYVSFKIKTLPSLAVGDTFSNNASIYFDYNFPIVTNTATTLIQQLGTNDFEFLDHFTLYPNPVKDIVKIKMNFATTIKSTGIYNMLGQLVFSVTGNQDSIDVSDLKSGNYLIKITSNMGIFSSQLIKE